MADSRIDPKDPNTWPVYTVGRGQWGSWEVNVRAVNEGHALAMVEHDDPSSGWSGGGGTHGRGWYVSINDDDDSEWWTNKASAAEMKDDILPISTGADLMDPREVAWFMRAYPDESQGEHTDIEIEKRGGTVRPYNPSVIADQLKQGQPVEPYYIWPSWSRGEVPHQFTTNDRDSLDEIGWAKARDDPEIAKLLDDDEAAGFGRRGPGKNRPGDAAREAAIHRAAILDAHAAGRSRRRPGSRPAMSAHLERSRGMRAARNRQLAHARRAAMTRTFSGEKFDAIGDFMAGVLNNPAVFTSTRHATALANELREEGRKVRLVYMTNDSEGDGWAVYIGRKDRRRAFGHTAQTNAWRARGSKLGRPMTARMAEAD